MSDIVELINDEGKKEKLILHTAFHIDDTEYAVLSYPDEEEGMIYRVDRDEKDMPIFNIVEDRDELQEVIDVYEGMAEELL
ncbi:MAG TPA: hypothetical protein DHM42_03890 [Clostridiales bacterium]|jgi:hypothetical protein|nr:hypothetical protein [Clostridiales bacterium]